MTKIEILRTEDLLAIIDERRKERGLSSRQLSEMVGLSHSSFWWWKKKAGSASLENALKYAAALDVKIHVTL